MFRGLGFRGLGFRVSHRQAMMDPAAHTPQYRILLLRLLWSQSG